ncbi:MAG: 16S rRNA (adenine(1518)-N(6)/adenine(1519)-N(6))-dimethyltransferase, partial [Candidatus Doudnabacteria bacterium]|nr:16S rRNA (adenine(1518)-N(6)/adenine(1519)-N(6))-dimethyltransferase [Candidatus Doudnabacteria bacterium]
VLEIGPGLGILTKRLAEQAGQVVAIEKDRKLIRVLYKLFKSKKNVKIIRGDILTINFNEFREADFHKFPRDARNKLQLIETDRNLLSRDYKVVANIPYYLTGKLLSTFLSSPDEGRMAGGQEGLRPSLMVLLLQKEVAQRIIAGPGQMSLLAVSVQFYADPEIISFVSKENFYPKPEVDSAIVKIAPLPNPPHRGEGNKKEFLPLEGGGEVGVIEEKQFFQLVKIGFSNKRKQLQNNLSVLNTINFHKFREADFYEFRDDTRNKLKYIETHGNYKQVLFSIGLNPLCRAQDLSLEDWGRLYNRLFQTRFDKK